jgi:hypothetical protein
MELFPQFIEHAIPDLKNIQEKRSNNFLKMSSFKAGRASGQAQISLFSIFFVDNFENPSVHFCLWKRFHISKNICRFSGVTGVIFLFGG